MYGTEGNNEKSEGGINFREVPGALEISSLQTAPYYWLKGGRPLQENLEVFFQSVELDLGQIELPDSKISLPVPYFFSDFAFSHYEKVEIQGDLGKRLCLYRLVYICGTDNDEDIEVLLRVENYTARPNTGGAAWAGIDFQRCEDSLIMGAEEESRGLLSPYTLLGAHRRVSNVRVINYNTIKGDGQQFDKMGVISLQNLFDNPPDRKVLVAIDFPDPPVIQEGKRYRRTVGETVLASVMDLIYGKFAESFDLTFRNISVNKDPLKAGGYRIIDESGKVLSSNYLIPGMEITITTKNK